MRIAVLGAAGQLGQDLCPRLPGEVIPLARDTLDLAHPDRIPAIVAALRSDVFVNCAAYNFVDRAETEPEAALAINGLGVRALARACRDSGTRFVHFSSDYVFGLDSSRELPLAEADEPGPVNVYGLSKLAGEYFSRAECPKSLVIRTCGLYGVSGSGGKGTNFVETMLRLAREGRPLQVVNDQRCTPSYTVDVAMAAVMLIEKELSGVFHATNSGFCTWYEFAAEIFRQSGMKPSLTAVSSAGSSRPARRPGFSVLSTAKLVESGISEPRPWTEALAEYLRERQVRTN